MQPTASPAAAYTNNRADGGNIIYGNVTGDVHFPSGDSGAARSTHHECLRDLRVTDPREDRTRIEDGKDKLLRDCYIWILEDRNFQQWRSQGGPRLLWIKGDPGKGKTMMTMGLIAELSQGYKIRSPSWTVSKVLYKLKLGFEPCLVAYFFCQNTRPEINSAVSVLRGLIYMLVDQQMQLMRHVQKRYKAAGKQLFEGANAIYALREILSDILNDPTLPTTYLLVDALDECDSGLPTLLQIITDSNLARRSKVKWLVTSRNVQGIERYLQPDLAGIKVSLEVCESHVSKAVTAFVNFKVQHLATTKKYDAGLQAEVQRVLRDRAEGTFLWISLVCKELENVLHHNTRKVLQAMPPGLDPLYNRMMKQILAQKNDTTAYCKAVLRALTLAFRPLHLLELVVVAGLPNDLFGSAESVSDLVARCGSFLAVRNNTVTFIHLSAKEYFTSGNGQQIFDGTVTVEHGQVTYRLLSAMRNTLRRDLCNLEKLRARTEGMVDRSKNSTIVHIAYACEYWIDHLCDSNLTSSGNSDDVMQDGGIVEKFLREKYLYWLEALSLCKRVPEGIAAIEKLWLFAQGREEQSSFSTLLKDARRFIMYHKGAIEDSALQVYASALLFSPKKSIVRNLFKHEEPDNITINPSMNDSWSACLQTLEGHRDSVRSVVFSHDSARLASASWDNTVKIWDTHSGVCLQTLEGHRSSVNSVVFSHDSARLASASNDNTIKIWDTHSGECLQTLRGYRGWVHSVAFSHDSARLASAIIKIWDAPSGVCLQTLEGHRSSVNSVAFSHDSARLASASNDNTIKIWDTPSGECLQTLEGHRSSVNSVAFLPDSARLASASFDNTVKIWDTHSGVCLQTLKGHRGWVHSVAFSPDSARLTLASSDNTIKIWDTHSGVCLQTFEDYGFSDLAQILGSQYPNKVIDKARKPVSQNIHISDDGVWICLNAHKLLWLPTEYRPGCTAISGEYVGIGTGHGKVWIGRFQ
ncbi:hypothetical protein GGP41_010115 [Bipolaris sorokiniana]|uniref:NACHT domain-containing protein n=1 Tax=Cochliobolus sativus TaxID=45130 RepID=A0A8H6DWE3_COCSA|nr:hypothetical protein GGP41_010115 [Bipolaris sorokiniana]